MSQDSKSPASEQQGHTVEHKFYKGNPHPYDESLPSFAAINVTESPGEGQAQKLTCEFITVAPTPSRDEETQAFKWRLIVEQINILHEDTRRAIFPRVRKLVEERVKIAYISASAPTRDTMIFSAGHAFRLNAEISEEHFLGLVGRYAFQDADLIDGILEKSQCESFRKLIGSLKQS